MPRPRVDIFLDNENKGTLQEGQNVMTLDAVNTGAHKLVILAKNQSGEVIDRREINFTAEPRTTVAQSNVETETHPAPATDTQASVPAPRAPEPPTARVQAVPPPPPAPAPAASMPREDMTATRTARLETLPETASSTPLLGATGLGLILTGLLIRRRGIQH